MKGEFDDEGSPKKSKLDFKLEMLLEHEFEDEQN